VAKAKKTTRKSRQPRVYAPCTHCGEPHHRFKECADGFRVFEGEPFTSPSSVNAAVAPDVALPTEPVPPAASVDPAEAARADLRAMIAAAPEGSQQRRSLELMLERDEARSKHAQDEKELQTISGNPDARLPVPNIIREKDEKKGRALLAQLDRVLGEARLAKDPRAMPPREEVMLVKETLASIPAKRDAEERAVKDALRRPEHMPGEQDWICREPTCGKRFRAGTLEMVRRKAKAEPGWRFVCPHCGGMHVELLMLEVVA